MRTGGPAGYLLELSREAGRSSKARGRARHELAFPDSAPPKARPARPSPAFHRLRKWRRALLGPPRFYRPSAAELNREGGVLHDLLTRAQADAIHVSRPSWEKPAELYFVHDVLAVPSVKASSRSREVWLLIHSPMPMALYLAWNWGQPEWPWEEIAALPDVRRWIERELESWSLADRVLLPCPEALEELVRVDPRFEKANPSIEYLLTGTSIGSGSSMERGEGEPLGLFLGSHQAYRGLDAIVKAVSLLPDRRVLPGRIAVAGPEPDSLPSHPRLRKLGPVEDVPALLAEVDFLVNANRFSLFDLSNIEAAAAGKPLLLHAVGGNKALARLGAGCRLFEALTAEAIAAALTEMFSMPRSALAVLGRRSRECYERHLTAEAMWERHLELYDKAESRILA